MSATSNHATSEEQLIRMLLSRNVRAVELLYDKYSCMLYGMIHRIVNDAKRAEEVLFKTFTYAWNHCNHFDSSSQSINIWMMTIARQLALDSLSQQERMNIESRLINSLKVSKVKEKMIVLELVFFHGLRVIKIAEKLGCSTSDVRTLLHHATAGLKNEFQQNE